jgi:hypothetical protein
MRTRNKQRIYRLFMTGASVKNLCFRYRTWIEIIESIIREGHVKGWDSGKRDGTLDQDHAIRQIGEILAYVAKIESELADYDELFALQRARMLEADRLWQRETGNAHKYPDLGTLLGWLMKRGGEIRA